jgi:hypothetical protein
MKIAKIVLPAVALTSALGFAGFASAGAPGPNGHNTFGLCTAYFAGSEKGQEMKHKAPPFAGLEAAAEASNQSVEEYCAANGTHPGKNK